MTENQSPGFNVWLSVDQIHEILVLLARGGIAYQPAKDLENYLQQQLEQWMRDGK